MAAKNAESVHAVKGADGITLAEDKFEILPGASSDLSGMSFAIYDEDHTLGNALRHVILQNPEVDFCGYSMPHPSLAKIHLRIQTTGSMTALQALTQGLQDLKEMCDTVTTRFEQVVKDGDYQLVDDDGDDTMQV
ncbi:RNA polymerase subunit AC19 [Dispira simplex]|nr:RNA polymerase subunit AC19 [Dispira simplex]